MTHLFENYARWETEIVSGIGTAVTDSEGKSYLDFTSGIGVCNLGHCHPEVTEAVTSQLSKLWHTSNLFKSTLQEKAAEKLVNASSGDFVFFCNSGAEANEAAIKLSRKHTGRHKIITFQKSFHGRTLGTMAATGQDKVKAGFGPMLETFVHVPYNDIGALAQEMDADTAAVMLEIVQGEGGVHPADEAFLTAAEELCTEYGALLIVDEVQTGMGRTGTPFAYQQYTVKPDIITSAKGLGNGFPVGAMIGKESLFNSFNPGSHGSTFGGNPLAMAAANKVMDLIFEERFLTSVKEKGEYLGKKLEEELAGLDGLLDIRHKGLMFGLEFTMDTGAWLSAIRKEGLLALNAGPNVIRLLPPLTVSIPEIDEAVKIIGKVLKAKQAETAQ
ncbi:MAG TPA: acetylornithine transaminase [Bacillaceae bacterium]